MDGVNDNLFRSSAPPQYHLQRIARQLWRQPADNDARPQVDDHGKILPAFIREKIHDVAGAEGLLQQIL